MDFTRKDRRTTEVAQVGCPALVKKLGEQIQLDEIDFEKLANLLKMKGYIHTSTAMIMATLENMGIDSTFEQRLEIQEILQNIVD